MLAIKHQYAVNLTFFFEIGYSINQAAKTTIDSSNHTQLNYTYTGGLTSSSKSFYILPIGAEEILRNIDKLNTNKGHGLSQIPIKYIKRAANIISLF